MSIISPQAWVQALIAKGVIGPDMEQQALAAIAADEAQALAALAADEVQAEQWIESLADRFEVVLQLRKKGTP